jgi:hypothetical protein
MTHLADFQTAFWHDLWAAPDALHSELAAQPGFAVYRNTVRTACVDALVSLYPAVHRLVGDDWLRAVALDHVRHHPPASGELQHYGEGFAACVAAALPPGELPWLADVARLDALWNQSHLAADAPLLDANALAALAPEHLACAAWRLHPATRWHASAEAPLYCLWHAARTEGADPNPPHWHGEAVLLTRPAGAVQACAIDAAQAALLQAFAEGLPLAAALEAVQARFPSSFDPGAALGLLLDQGAFSGVITETAS